MVGADGRVKEVNIERPLRRNTAALLAAVQYVALQAGHGERRAGRRAVQR